MKKTRMNQVFDHFNREAEVFDSGILKSVPHYQEMIGAIIDFIPFSEDKKIDLLDVGTGTGNISYNLKKAFPASRLVCLDLAPKMLEVAKEKLRDFENIEFVQADVSSYKFDRKFDAIVSSLTLHHLETDKDKHAFHKKAYQVLKKGGVFINADIIVAPDKKTQEIYLAKWKAFILKSSSPEFVEDRYRKYLAEDRPAVLLNEIASLKKAGFKNVEVFWKYYNFSVYGGTK
jgi:tRNA (cmo5U34)-methyltransferase